MDDTLCKKCGHLCHCIEEDHEGCKCGVCDCAKSKAKDQTNESGGLVIDDTGECESCQ